MADHSPFPGMDPWLESYWGDVHHELITELRRQAVPQLPADLFAVVEETVYIVADEWGDRTYGPDVGVFGGDSSPLGRPAPMAATALAEPLRMTLASDPVTEKVTSRSSTSATETRWSPSSKC